MLDTYEARTQIWMIAMYIMFNPSSRYPVGRGVYPPGVDINTLFFAPYCQEILQFRESTRFFTIEWTQEGIDDANARLAEEEREGSAEFLRLRVKFDVDDLNAFRFKRCDSLAPPIEEPGLNLHTVLVGVRSRQFDVRIGLPIDNCLNEVEEGAVVSGKLTLVVDSATIIDTTGEELLLPLGEIEISEQSNDSLQLRCYSECELEEPILAVQDTLDFGAHYCGESVARNLEVCNDGECTLTITDLQINPHGPFDLGEDVPTSFALGPGLERNITLTHEPGDIVGESSAVLTISSNDLRQPRKDVELKAVVREGPKPDFKPPQKRIRYGTVSSTTSRSVVVIENRGCVPFEFDCVLEGNAPAPWRNFQQLESRLKLSDKERSEPPTAWKAEIVSLLDGHRRSFSKRVRWSIEPRESAEVSVEFNPAGFPIYRTARALLVITNHNDPRGPEEFRWGLIAHVSRE